MEASGGVSGGVTVVGSDAPSDYHVAPRTENPAPAGGSAGANPSPANQGGAPPQPQPPTAVETEAPAAEATVPTKKKRGRPRKYGPDGSVVALSPTPISSSAPLPPVIDFSAEKRAKVWPASSSVSKARFEVENLGKWVPYSSSVGADYTHHYIDVNPGEDVTMKIISFSQQEPRAICVMSANGFISSLTIRQPDSSGGTLTYEGQFEILTLRGSFMPNETGGPRSRSGGMSISVAAPDGRVIGGGVAGLLIAASPVQVTIGSFLVGNQHEQQPMNQKHEILSTVTPTATVPISTADPIPILSSPSSFPRDSWSAMPADGRNKPADINVSVPGG